jgi:hypothetical protein
MKRMNVLKPEADKKWLILLAGIVWSGVGIMLSRLAYGWLKPVALNKALLLASGGVLLAVIIYRFGFSKLADINIERILAYVNDKICIFAFQQWTSYPLIVVMITMGIGLRKYSPIPKPWLAVMYIGIGGSLFLASMHYYQQLVRANTDKKAFLVRGAEEGD